MTSSTFVPDIIGIDLGTTHSLVAYWQDGQTHLIPNALGDVLTPSIVSMDRDGSYLVGAPARERLQTHPSLTASSFKRAMGSAATFRLGDKTFRAEDLSALVLKSLRSDVRARFGVDVDRAIITVPAYFSESQRTATRNAALIAGFSDVGLLNEPTAAAMAYGLNKEEDSQFLVFDFGGGTFDVSILELFAGVMEVRATAGDNQLGGDDVDACIERWVMNTAQLPDRLLQDVQFVAKLRAHCERAKRTLGQGGSSTLQFSHEDHRVDLALDEPTLERLIQPILERLRHPVEVAIRDARITTRDLAAVVLAGGSSRLMAVRQLVTRMFGQFPNASINPDEVVARGAAVQAALKANAAELGERVMTDVCPYTLGVAVSRRVGDERKVDGMMGPILPRNTVIPASRVEVFYPSHPQQTIASIQVYQGEARLVRDNILLGEVELPMPLSPSGQQHDRSLSVRFTYDVDGLLEVEGTPLRDGVPSGETRRLVIQSSAERLSDAQVKERLAALAALKLHPRDRMEVRTLLARAERLFTQLRVEEREPFGHAITRFELVLDGQDPRQIEAAQLELLAMVRQMEALTPLGL